MPLTKVPEHVEKRKAKRGQFRTTKKPYHDKTTLHKSQRHPHSRLKTQKEYKTITDSSAYKKADYHTQNKMLKKHPTTMKAGGSVTRFRSSGEEGKPHSTKEGRSAEAQRAYMRKFGSQEPRRKRIWPKLRTAKATGGKLGRKGFRGIGSIYEQLGGGVKRKPHSTKEGRIASGKRRLGRLRKKAMDDYHDESWAGKDPEKGKPHSSQEGRIATGRRNFRKALQRHAGGAKPLRAKHGLGSLVKGVKKIISKIKPKPPKGVAVKPVPKVVTDVDKPFKGYDKSYTRADDKKMDALLKKLGDEIKAQPLPPKTKELVKKLQKAYPHKKAEGGRIGLKKGSVHKPGSHSWYLQHMNKNKKASGGRANFRDGGRTNLLEELGRVEAEPSNRNRRAEVSRVHRELNRGYKSGGAVLKGKKVGIQIK